MSYHDPKRGEHGVVEAPDASSSPYYYQRHAYPVASQEMPTVYCPAYQQQPQPATYSHHPHAQHQQQLPTQPYPKAGGDEFYDPEAAQVAEHVPSSFMESTQGQIRLALLRKVYSILSIQLLTTVGVACLFCFNRSVSDFVLATPQLFTLALVLSFACLIGLFCFKQKHPWNMVLLVAFTLCQSFLVGLICAIYYRQGSGELVLQAFGITLAIFVGLTAYTYYSDKDFSFLGGFCMAGLIGLIVWGLISWLTGWRSTFFYSLFGALLFSALIVYDTWLLSKRFGPEQAIIASIMLYLDIINLFLFILQLLGGSRRD
ncbi:transmembrane bax inhibitor motif-containing protein 4 [Nannochloropsis oceanica]